MLIQELTIKVKSWIVPAMLAVISYLMVDKVNTIQRDMNELKQDVKTLLAASVESRVDIDLEKQEIKSLTDKVYSEHPDIDPIVSSHDSILFTLPKKLKYLKNKPIN